MKVVILAGGLGTRISEESHLRPKPMIEIGEKPILWHIMKHYSSYGYNEFVICCGYRQYIIKEFFSEYCLHMSDVTFDFTAGNGMAIHNSAIEPWKITLVDTGLNTMTGGRVKRVIDYVGGEAFMLTYGDGVSDVDISELVEFHKSHGKIATLTSIQPGSRFGTIDIGRAGTISSFREKPRDDDGWINGGFMIMNEEIFDYIEGDSTVLEREPLESIVAEGQLKAYRHYGFWQCMDTLRDKHLLEDLWEGGDAPWKSWK